MIYRKWIIFSGVSLNPLIFKINLKTLRRYMEETRPVQIIWKIGKDIFFYKWTLVIMFFVNREASYAVIKRYDKYFPLKISRGRWKFQHRDLSYVRKLKKKKNKLSKTWLQILIVTNELFFFKVTARIASIAYSEKSTFDDDPSSNRIVAFSFGIQ